MLIYGGVAILVILIIVVCVRHIKSKLRADEVNAQAAAAAKAQADAQAAAAAKAQADAQAAAAAKAQADAQAAAAAKAQPRYQVSTEYSNKYPSSLEKPWTCVTDQGGAWCSAPIDSAAELCDSLDLCVGYMVNLDYPDNPAQLLQHYPNAKGTVMYLKPPPS